MIKLILKLAVVALLANAMWHVFGVFAPHYRLVDAVQSASQFRGDASDAALAAKVLLLAGQFDIPLTEDDVKVTHDETRTTVDLSYIRLIEFAPGISRPWPFTAHVETLNARAPVPELAK